jgi:hypothetical protein
LGTGKAVPRTAVGKIVHKAVCPAAWDVGFGHQFDWTWLYQLLIDWQVEVEVQVTLMLNRGNIDGVHDDYLVLTFAPAYELTLVRLEHGKDLSDLSRSLTAWCATEDSSPSQGDLLEGKQVL